LYISDFETRQIIVSADGLTVSDSFQGVAGGGDALPRLAVYRGLLLIADPIGQRVLMFERATGRQRGAFAFSRGQNVRPSGIGVSADGLVYVADATGGLVYRLRIDAPDELLGQ
jgi:glucose/arabinose dehydrogenase